MYREYPSRTDGVVCTWERVSAVGGIALVVPDGCVDVVAYGDGRVLVAGPDTRPWRSPVEPDLQIVGVRLAAGVARTFLGLPLSELRDRRVPVAEVGLVGGVADLAELVGDASNSDRRAVLAAAIDGRLGASDPLVAAAVRKLECAPQLRVSELAALLGVSARHLQRSFVEHVGYGPKMFARVARLQRFLGAEHHPSTLVDVAYESGFSSQSHLCDEVRDLTGMTPVRFLEERRRPAA